MIRINQIKMPVKHSEKDLYNKISSILRLNKFFKERLVNMDYLILKKSIDARKKPEIYYTYSVAVNLDKSIEERILKYNKSKDISLYKNVKYTIPNTIGDNSLTNKPVVVGSGPAGLFCAYILCQMGYMPIVLERGENVEKRVETVDKFWSDDTVNTDSNVQFGEGGAGTFSDGKLNTMVNDKSGRNDYVLNTFVKFGAKEEINYLSKPHLGTDELVNIVRNMRNEIINRGGQFMFNTKLTELVYDENGVKSVVVDNSGNKQRIESNCVVLAIGHSARDTFEMLKANNIEMQQKNFAVGLRIQHPQKLINECQYGADNACDSNSNGLPAADYKLVNHTSNGRSVYSFCMCPGGYVVNASSERNRLAINGMSYSDRGSSNANSALVVSVDSKDFKSDDVLAGLEYQRTLEETAYKIGNGHIPVQLFRDYKENKISEEMGEFEPLFKGNYEFANLRDLFSDDINEAIIESIYKFGYTMKGFDRDDAILAGIESRTSSPVRIVRNDDYETNIKGLYPCGEGAGYAGGITSAAMDGIRTAEMIIKKYKPIKDINYSSL